MSLAARDQEQNKEPSMSEKIPETLDEAVRQVGQHIDSCRAAGIEWVPNEPLPEPGPAPGPVRPAVSLPLASAEPALQTSLFATAPVEAPTGDSDQRRQELAL